MCGRFALYADESEIVSHFSLSHGFSMRSRYNIAPTQTIPVITSWQGKMEFFRWGFIPPWEKEVHAAGYMNARAESITEKATFKQAFISKRCLIPASGYYEWRSIGQQKQPYFISLKNKPLFAFAGIWSSHHTCAILTKEAPVNLQSLHPRIPLVIPREFYQSWLKTGPLSFSLLDLSMIQDAENLVIKAVSRQMSAPSFEGPACILAL